jgi:uncharacterized membrane protein YvbJ
MIECCGKERDTRYCPDCGKQLIDHKLHGLLKHCELNAGSQRALLDKSTRRQREKDTEAVRNQIKKRAAVVHKWQTWADVLRKLIAQTSGDAVAMDSNTEERT